MRVMILSLRQKLSFDRLVIQLMFADAFHGPGAVLMVGDTRSNLIGSVSLKSRCPRAEAAREGKQQLLGVPGPRLWMVAWLSGGL